MRDGVETGKKTGRRKISHPKNFTGHWFLPLVNFTWSGSHRTLKSIGGQSIIFNESFVNWERQQSRRLGDKF